MKAHPYAGQALALLTQHGKEAVLAPLLEPALGCRVVRVSGFDTDRLGTFTRDIPRPGTLLETARRKAQIGIKLSGAALGLASEGAFGPDPMLGTLPWNTELVLCIDTQRGIEVAGWAEGATRFAHRLVGDWAAAQAFAQEAGFPEHALVVRPEHPDNARIEKGIANWPALQAAFARALAASANGLVCLEHDVRAHLHPTRREAIRRAAENLRDKLLSLCPACGAPGFWVVEQIPGRLCAACGAPTSAARAEVWGCLCCGRREERPLKNDAADPAVCAFCNP